MKTVCEKCKKEVDLQAADARKCLLEETPPVCPFCKAELKVDGAFIRSLFSPRRR